MKRAICAVAAALVAIGAAAWAETIRDGEQREVAGVLKAVTATSKTVVVDAQTAKGALTVGAAAAEKAVLTRGGKAVGFNELKAGQKVKLTYKRAGDALLFTALDVSE